MMEGIIAVHQIKARIGKGQICRIPQQQSGSLLHDLCSDMQHAFTQIDSRKPASAILIIQLLHQCAGTAPKIQYIPHRKLYHQLQHERIQFPCMLTMKIAIIGIRLLIKCNS